MKILHIEGGRNLYGGPIQVVHLVQGLEKKEMINPLNLRTTVLRVTIQLNNLF